MGIDGATMANVWVWDSVSITKTTRNDFLGLKVYFGELVQINSVLVMYVVAICITLDKF